MKPQIRLNKNQVADFRLISNLGAGAVRDVITEIGKLAHAVAQPQTIKAAIEHALKGNADASEALLRQVLSLHGFIRQLNLNSKEVFAGITEGLHQPETEFSTNEFEKWCAVSAVVQELFELEVVRLSSKALDLSFAHSELLQRARILTDIRPVFNQEASEIRGTVISHSLLLRYDNLEGDHSLSLALDEEDIDYLKCQCERALTKSRTARKVLEGKLGIPVIVPGSDKDEEN